MNLGARRNEDPEINLVSLIDVVLMLVIFFMLSSTFIEEGRVRIRLPYADTVATRAERQSGIVVGVTRSGTYSVDGRELLNSSPETLARRAAVGCDCAGRVRAARNPARRRRGHAPVGGARARCARQARIPRNPHCDGRPGIRRDSARYAFQFPLSDQAVSDPRAVYRRLLRYVRPHLGTFMIGVVGMTLFASTDAALAWFVKYFFDGTFVKPDPRMLWTVPLGAVGLFTLRGIGDYVGNYFPGSVGRHVVMKLRQELYARYLRLPVSYYDQAATGAMLSRLTYNTELVAEACTNSITVMIRDTLTIAGFIVTLFVLNWKLAAFVVLLAPLVSALIGKINKLFSRYSTRIQNSMGDITRVAKETLDAQRVIKVFRAEAQQQGVFERVIEHNRHSNMRLVSVKALSNPVVQQVAAVGLSGVLYLAIRQTLDGSMTAGTFMAFITALLGLTAPMRRLVNVFGPLQQGIAAADGIFKVLDTPIEDEGGTRALTRAQGDVEFVDVSFRYRVDKAEALSNISFCVPAGRTCAIVGRSGGGKSTLVSLLPRFYDPDGGEVRIDGVSVREYRRSDLRRNVSFVSQDVMLLDDTLRNNIAFGTADADGQAVEAAAEMAHVMEFARDLPQGLDTLAGERGAQLSGGQRQRIAIARALLKDAPILILDEATSALDTESERRIQTELDALRRNRTTLVIAHRLSTIESADMIVVLDDGRLVEQGTHANLLARNGLYAQLHRLQFNA